MFDTLYGTKSFQSKAFCEFLVKNGEKALAEQIALASIEKSGGKGEHVAFLLEELMPHSDEPETLVSSVKELLSRRGTEGQSGKDVLIQWFMQQGSSHEAFSLALIITDEAERLKEALPLATTPLRRQQLKDSCKFYLTEEVIGMFEDDGWPAFMLSLPKTSKPKYKWWVPDDESYLDFAAKSMTAPNNVKDCKPLYRKCFP